MEWIAGDRSGEHPRSPKRSTPRADQSDHGAAMRRGWSGTTPDLHGRYAAISYADRVMCYNGGQSRHCRR